MDKKVVILSLRDKLALHLSQELSGLGYIVNIVSDNFKKTDYKDASYVYALPSYGDTYIEDALNVLVSSSANLVVGVSMLKPSKIDFAKLNNLSRDGGRVRVVYFGEVIGLDKGEVWKLRKNLKSKRSVVLPSRNYLLKFTFVDRLSLGLINAPIGNSYFGFSELFWNLANYFKKSDRRIDLLYSDRYFLHAWIDVDFEIIEKFGNDDFLKIFSYDLSFKKKTYGGTKKFLVFGILVCIWAIILPFLAIFVSFGLSIWSLGELANGGNKKTSPWKVEYSAKFANLGRFGFSMFGLGYLYDVSDVTFSLNKLAWETIDLQDNLSRVSNEVVNGCKSCNLFSDIQMVYLESDKIYRDLLFVKSRLVVLQPLEKALFKKNNDFGVYENYILSVRNVSSFLPSFLGESGEKKYILVFLNENNIMPVGGSIESLAIVTVNNGKIVGWDEINPKFIDESMNGAISPLKVFSGYFGENQMSLSDVGWNQDFDNFSNSLSWFLERSLGWQVDGVLAVNNKAKEGVLSAKNSPSFLSQAYELWQNKDLQISGTRRVLGSFDCGDNCKYEHFGLWEMKIDGEDSLVVTRKARLETFVADGIVKNKLTYDLETGSKEYKVYLKLSLFGDGNVGRVIVNGENRIGDLSEDENGDFGLYVYVLKNSKSSVSFEWTQSANIKTSLSGKYVVLWERQSGIPGYPVSVSVRSSRDFLTSGNFGLYNTVLSGNLLKEFDF